MSKQQIWNTLSNLACSQGMYGRILRDIEESGRKDEILGELEEMNFKGPLDLIYYLEC